MKDYIDEIMESLDRPGRRPGLNCVPLIDDLYERLRLSVYGPDGNSQADATLLYETAAILEALIRRVLELELTRMSDAERDALDYAQKMIDDVNRGDPQKAEALRLLRERLG